MKIVTSKVQLGVELWTILNSKQDSGTNIECQFVYP